MRHRSVKRRGTGRYRQTPPRVESPTRLNNWTAGGRDGPGGMDLVVEAPVAATWWRQPGGGNLVAATLWRQPCGDDLAGGTLLTATLLADNRWR